MKKFNNQFATQKLRENEDTEVTVSGIDRITGLESWDSTIESLISSGWDLEPQDIEAIKNGETVKLISPNGRRKISVSLKKTDYMKHREDSEHYEKEFQKTGTSDYFQRRGLDEEGNATGGGEAYLPGLDVPEKKYKGPEESKDVEPKLAAGKAKVYMKDKWGWKDAPSVPNRPSKMFDYKDLWAEEKLNENYSRFKKETRTKTNEQQFHAAVRLAEKKISEANRILEYTAQLKSELSVIKENKNTQKLMERITRGIAEAYGKMKKLKL